MKPKPIQQSEWNWPYPSSWTDVFAVITLLLLAYLGAAHLLDCLKGALP